MLVLLSAAPAAGSSRLIVGVTEDGLKFEPDAVRRDAAAVGLRAVRITLQWSPGLAAPNEEQRTELERASRAAGPLRIVLSVFGERAADAPRAGAARDQYCEFLRNVVARYPRIRDVAVWNEPNKAQFWQPQFDARGESAAPRAYEELLARCWDVLHAQRSDVNVLAPSTAPRGNDRPEAVSNVSHSPVRFLEELGTAYRASGRDRPIFDTVAHHVHGSSAAERPWQTHPGRSVSQGDYARLVATLQRAFRGSAQPVPGRCGGGRCVPIWYLEAGFQTAVNRRKASLYSGRNIGGNVVPDLAGPVDLDPLPPASSEAPDQASQLVAALGLAYCQPYVEGFFNFLLWDEPRLEGWQSGLYWVDRTPKSSAAIFREAVRDVQQGRVSCARLRRQLPEATAVLVPPSAVPPASATTSSAATTSAAPAGASGDDDDGLDLRVIGPGAALLVLVGVVLIAAARRRSRTRRNSR
jgi:hypothetical protein